MKTKHRKVQRSKQWMVNNSVPSNRMHSIDMSLNFPFVFGFHSILCKHIYADVWFLVKKEHAKTSVFVLRCVRLWICYKLHVNHWNELVLWRAIHWFFLVLGNYVFIEIGSTWHIHLRFLRTLIELLLWTMMCIESKIAI